MDLAHLNKPAVLISPTPAGGWSRKAPKSEPAKKQFKQDCANCKMSNIKTLTNAYISSRVTYSFPRCHMRLMSKWAPPPDWIMPHATVLCFLLFCFCFNKKKV